MSGLVAVGLPVSRCRAEMGLAVASWSQEDGYVVASWAEDDGYVVVDGSGSWEDVPTGNLGWARMLTFEGPIGPVPADRVFPRTWSLEGRASEHVHGWARLPMLRDLTLRYARPEHLSQLAQLRVERLAVYQGTGRPAGTVWPALPTVVSASWALMPVVALHGLVAPCLEDVDLEGVRECLGLEELLVSSPVQRLDVWNVRQVPSPQALWDAAEGIEHVHWGGDAKAGLWVMELALGPTSRLPVDTRAPLDAVRRRAMRMRKAVLKEMTFSEDYGSVGCVRAVIPSPSGEVANLMQRMGATDPGVFWGGLLSVRWPCLPAAGVRVAVEGGEFVVRGPRDEVDDTVALLAWWCSSPEVLASVVDVLLTAGLAGEAFAGGEPRIVPVSRLVTGTSGASIEKLEERTYVLTMPMQPVPATQALGSRGLEHSGHTWDQIGQVPGSGVTAFGAVGS